MTIGYFLAVQGQHKLLNQWLNGLAILHKCHFTAATSFERKNILLGIPVIVISAIVGSAAFASIETEANMITKIVVGVLSISAAIAASLQTFLKYSERAEKHKIAATSYGVLRRELEQSLAMAESRPITVEFMDSIRSRWDDLDKETPTLSEEIYNSVQKLRLTGLSDGNAGNPKATSTTPKGK